jgi:hypothetical protein
MLSKRFVAVAICVLPAPAVPSLPPVSTKKAEDAIPARYIVIFKHDDVCRFSDVSSIPDKINFTSIEGDGNAYTQTIVTQ